MGDYDDDITWRPAHAALLARRTADAQALVGRTIAGARVEAHDANCDADNVLLLTMTDGTVWRLEGDTRNWTGHSCDEYPETLKISQGSGTV